MQKLRKQLLLPHRMQIITSLNGHSTTLYIYIYIYIYIYSEVSALLDVRHCPKLQSFAISEKTRTTNEVTFRR